MKELRHTLLELGWEYIGGNCDFCSNRYKAVNLIKTRHEKTDELIAVDCVCEDCKVKFLNNELPKCGKCGRLKTRTDITLGGICDCQKEDAKEKELPTLPHERMTTFYERQINGLREELNTAEVEIDTHLEALEISEDWHKRQKQELLDRIKELEAENRRLKGSTSQELLDEINKLKEKVKQLEEQNTQLTAQIEVKETKKWHWKLKK